MTVKNPCVIKVVCVCVWMYLKPGYINDLCLIILYYIKTQIIIYAHTCKHFL